MFIQENIERKLFLSSDSHYNHSNICKATTKWKKTEIAEGHSGYRNFNSLKDMNGALVAGYNKHVSETDVLIHLGDWSFGGIESIFKFRKQLRCREVHLVLGNHDHHIRNNKILPFDQQEEALALFGHKTSDGIIRTQDLFESVQEVLHLKVQRHKNQKAIPVFLSHYSHRVWDGHHKGVYHAFGHSHGSLDYAPNGRSIDVGVDTAFKKFKEYRPYYFKEFIDICNTQEIQIIDNHGLK